MPSKLTPMFLIRLQGGLAGSRPPELFELSHKIYTQR